MAFISTRFMDRWLMSEENADDISTDGADEVVAESADVAVIVETELAPAPVPGVSVTINGRSHAAKPGQLVIDACADAGAYVPHFCYHPRMTPVGMCRQCLVEVEGPRGPMMVVSCMTPVSEGQVVNTATPGVKRAQEGVLELLLANHPLDCPVCDKGGECPLQDQAFSHGPGESRYLEEKRHYEKPIPISDLVYLDRERCILCDRCTRFADEVAGDKLIHFISRGNDTQVMTFPDEPFASYFSGNTVQICPVGALTAKPYRFKARPWDLEQVESTCTTCSVGCRTVIQSSRDELLRYQGVDSEPVNWGWLCDRGRFGFESLNSDERLGVPLVQTGSALEPTSWSSAMAAITEMLTEALGRSGPSGIAILGGARGTNEDAFAWAQLADRLGITRHDPQIADGIAPQLLNYPRATIAEAANAATVILLGPDLKEELPVLFLRIRDAAEKRRSRIIEFAPMDTGMTRYAWRSERYEPGFTPQAVRARLADPEVAAQLMSGDVVVVVGRGNLAESDAVTLAALGEVLSAAPEAKVLPVLRRGNVMGALQMGLAPQSPSDEASQILQAAADGQIDVLVLLGADPLADCPDAELARRALAGARRVISLDTFLTASSAHADVVLPAAAYGEKAGTTTNLEGRITSVTAKVTVHGTARPDWMVAVDLAGRLGVDLGLADLAGITAAIASQVPGCQDLALVASGRATGAQRDGILCVVPMPEILRPAAEATERVSYDYRLVVSRKLYDGATNTQMAPSLAPLAPGAAITVNPADLAKIGAEEGSSVKVIGVRSATVMNLSASAAVPRGVAWVPCNQPGGAISEVLNLTDVVTDVRIERLS
jgi:NADH-quinone oxidoreductase subunit G